MRRSRLSFSRKTPANSTSWRDPECIKRSDGGVSEPWRFRSGGNAPPLQNRRASARVFKIVHGRRRYELCALKMTNKIPIIVSKKQPLAAVPAKPYMLKRLRDVKIATAYLSAAANGDNPEAFHHALKNVAEAMGRKERGMRTSGADKKMPDELIASVKWMGRHSRGETRSGRVTTVTAIRTRRDHENALKEVEKLWDAKPGTRDATRLELLVRLIQPYEAKLVGIDDPEPDVMPATKLKLSAALTKRVKTLAANSGRTAHAFMVEAITQATEREELRQKFFADARRAEQSLLRTGKVHDLDQVFDYLKARVQGGKAKRSARKSAAPTRTPKRLS